MEEATIIYNGEALTATAFEELAKTNVQEWLNVFANVQEKPISRHRLTKAIEHGDYEDVLGFEIRQVYAKGGTEGDGEHVERAYAILNPSKEIVNHFKFFGFYESYEGTEWDQEIYECEPVQVTITQYHLKKEA